MNYNKNLLTTVFNTLNESNLDYVVQNKYEKMPEEIPSDIDMMYREVGEKELDIIVKKVSEKTELLITQKIVQDYGEFTYILTYPAPEKSFQLQLDFYRVISKGNIHNVLLGKDLLDNKRRYKNFYIPEKYDEIRYIVVRRTLKKDFSKEHLKKIIDLYDGCSEKLICSFGIKTSQLILNMIETNSLEPFYQNYKLFQDSILNMSIKNYKIIDKFALFKFKLLNYPTKRIIHTCGMSVAFLAPDGTGKSTVIAGVKETCSGSFYGVESYYFRPRLLKNLGHYNKLNPSEEATVNLNPHNVKLNSKTKSLVRFMFYNLDFILGMKIKVYKEKIQKKLVIFDRYYYDYYADLKRYQYNINPKVVRFFRYIIPSPDLTIVLDAETDVIYKRKQELTPQEIEDQRIAFREAADDIRNCIIIDTNKNPKLVISEVTELILRKQAKRTAKILKC